MARRDGWGRGGEGGQWRPASLPSDCPLLDRRRLRRLLRNKSAYQDLGARLSRMPKEERLALQQAWRCRLPNADSPPPHQLRTERLAAYGTANQVAKAASGGQDMQCIASN